MKTLSDIYSIGLVGQVVNVPECQHALGPAFESRGKSPLFYQGGWMGFCPVK